MLCMAGNVSPTEGALILESTTISEFIFEDYFHKLMGSVAAIRKIAQAWSADANISDAEIYDQTHQHVEFNVGDLVLVYNPHRKVNTTSKLNHRFYGPFEVLERVSFVKYRVRACFDLQTIDTVHIYRMKKYTPRNPEPSVHHPHEIGHEKGATRTDNNDWRAVAQSIQISFRVKVKNPSQLLESQSWIQLNTLSGDLPEYGKNKIELKALALIWPVIGSHRRYLTVLKVSCTTSKTNPGFTTILATSAIYLSFGVTGNRPFFWKCWRRHLRFHNKSLCHIFFGTTWRKQLQTGRRFTNIRWI